MSNNFSEKSCNTHHKLVYNLESITVPFFMILAASQTILHNKKYIFAANC